MSLGCRVDPPNQQVSPQVDILINMSGSALGGILIHEHASNNCQSDLSNYSRVHRTDLLELTFVHTMLVLSNHKVIIHIAKPTNHHTHNTHTNACEHTLTKIKQKSSISRQWCG